MNYSQEKEDPCSTCGSADSGEVICVCSRCRDRAHVWCMRTVLRTVPNNWVCDECQMHSSTIPPVPSLTQPSTRMKDTKPCKVKFLPTSEAAILSNDVRSNLLPEKNNVRKRYQLPFKKNHPHLRIGSPVKPSAPIRDFRQLAEDLRENRKLKGTRKKISVTEKPSTCPASSSIKGKCDGSYEKEKEGHEQESMDKVQSKEKAIFGKFTKNPVSTDAVWSGQLEILNDPDLGLIGSIRAFTPCWVHRKAYFFSLNLPSSLSFNLISRNVLWDEVFKDIPPNEDDVALYILPGNFDRSKDVELQPYKHLLQMLDLHDYAMHAYIDGVELIVLSSRWLEVKCKEPESQRFLWGSYRCVLPKYVTSDKDNNTALGEEVNADAYVDMEVEMLDGESIEPQEVFVSKETKPNRLELTQMAPGSNDPSNQTSKSVNEEHLAFPPGFEQEYKLKRKADDML